MSSELTVTLYEPEIPPNTGNIIRLCANAGAKLNLIEPLGFKLDDKRMRRAGLDYHEFSDMTVFPNYSEFKEQYKNQRVFACSTHGEKFYHEIDYQPGDVFLFGPETRGLPVDVRESYPKDQIIKIPMAPNNRSLNLSNSVGIILFEAWRQLGFKIF